MFVVIIIVIIKNKLVEETDEFWPLTFFFPELYKLILFFIFALLFYAQPPFAF